jgi:hypothetical protein
LGTVIALGPDWDARVSESNSCAVGTPNDYLIHTEFPVDELVWLSRMMSQRGETRWSVRR